MVAPLLAFAGRGEARPHRPMVAGALGKIGPDPAARGFLRGLVRGGGHDERWYVVTAAAEWGREGAGLPRELVAVPDLADTVRRDAVEASGRCGDPAADGPTLVRLLAGPPGEPQGAAVKAVLALRSEPALPELERIARDKGIDCNVRKYAVDAALAVAPRDRGDRLLLDPTGPGHRKGCGTVFERVGQRRSTAALPALLAAVGDADWYTRVMAAAGLRGLAGLWEGVGYDPRTPDPAKWRTYWANKGD